MDRRLYSLVLAMSLAVGCLQKVDDGLAVSSREVDPPACGGGQAYGCMFPVNTTTPAVGLHANAAGDVIDSADAADGCAKVEQDATDILQRKCSGCHEGAGTAINSSLTFILETDKLISTPSSMQFNGQPYVLPGNPARSLIYQRAVINKDMPYSPSTLVLPNFLTVSESSVLYQWIASCVGSPPVSGDMGAGGMAASGGGASGLAAGGAGASGLAAGGAGASGLAVGGAGASGLAVGGAPAGGMGAVGSGAVGRETGGVGGELEVGGSAGTAAAGNGTAVGNALPCDGLCQTPTVFTVPPSYQSPGFGPNAACYQTISTLAGFSCGNAMRRTVSINGTAINCGAPPTINTVPRRNGGYCVQAAAGGNQSAFFRAN